MPAALIQEMVHDSYWKQDINCARTALRVLSSLHTFPLHEQVVDAAIGMHGAGGFRGQCGLVEGTLMFMGVLLKAQHKTEAEIADICRTFAAAFTERFGSLSCFFLRPDGFTPDDEPHLCEALTIDAIAFAHRYIRAVAKRLA